jgi:sugar phosphate permease
MDANGTSMKRSAAASQRDPHRWVVFGIISLIYFFVYFHRVSTSVIVSDLLAAFGTTATALGLMSSMYFYIYAANQPLMGYLADRIGPRRVIAFSTLAAAAGCLIFGLAPSIGWASAGRALIGFGVGGVYVPTVKALSQWFREKEFATMVGLLMSVGNLGAVVATTPLAWAAGTWGWRPTFFLIGAISLAMAVLMLTVTRDARQTKDREASESSRPEKASTGLWSSIGAIMASKQFWLVVAAFFFFYGTAVALQGLWATPFLMAALGIERILASQLNMLIPIGVIVGSPLVGWLLGRFSLRKSRALRAITAIYCLCWLALMPVFKDIGLFGYAAAMLAMGFMIGGFISTIWGIIRETTPNERLGLTSGLLNPAPFFGVAVFQVLTGSMIESAGQTGEMVPLASFTGAFGVCLAGALISLVFSFFIRSKPQMT